MELNFSIEHPSSKKEWESLDTEDREKRILLWRNEIKKIRERERRKAATEKITYDWSLIPNTIEQTMQRNPPIIIGEVFKTRQHLELRISEICNMLCKKPRYSKISTDLHGEGGRKDGMFLCCRSHSADDEFMLKASIKDDECIVNSVKGLEKSLRSSTIESHNRKCSFTGIQLAPIILNLNESALSISYSTMNNILKMYVSEGTITKGIMDEVKLICVHKFIGAPNENIKHLFNLEAEMEKLGYIVELETCDRFIMEKIFIENVQKQHKFEQSKKEKSERTRFSAKYWKVENSDFLKKALGTEKTDFFSFLYICF